MKFKKEDFVYSHKGSHSVTFYVYNSSNKYHWNSIDYPTSNCLGELKQAALAEPDSSTRNFSMGGIDFTGKHKDICFARLQGIKLSHKKKYALEANRLLFDITKAFSVPNSHIDKTDMHNWLKYCKEYNFIPKYLPITGILKHGFAVFDLTKHGKRQLFIYLSMLRFLHAETQYVKNVLNLVEKYNVDFVAAVCFASRLVFGNIHHHFLTTGAPKYPSPTDINKIKDAALCDVFCIKKLISSPENSWPKIEDNITFGVDSTIRKMVSRGNTITYSMPKELLTAPWIKNLHLMEAKEIKVKIDDYKKENTN